MPEIVGGELLTGGSTVTTAVGAEVERPTVLLAPGTVSSTRSVEWTSAEVAVYVWADAPLIGVQLLPDSSHRSHM